MKSIDQWLQEAIERYRRLTTHTEQLGEQIQALNSTAITEHCSQMDVLRREICEYDAKLLELLTFLGHGVLDNPLVASYQQALGAALAATDKVAAKARRRKDLLLDEISAGKRSRQAIAGYSSGITHTSVLQKFG